jgi:hypothetical protein
MTRVKLKVGNWYVIQHHEDGDRHLWHVMEPTKNGHLRVRVPLADSWYYPPKHSVDGAFSLIEVPLLLVEEVFRQWIPKPVVVNLSNGKYSEKLQ